MKDYKTKYTFTKIESDGSSLTYECSNTTTSWEELIEDFTYFLRGCGFILDGEFEFVTKEEACREAEWAHAWDAADYGKEKEEKLDEEEWKDSESVGLENTISSGKEL